MVGKMAKNVVMTIRKSIVLLFLLIWLLICDFISTFIL